MTNQSDVVAAATWCGREDSNLSQPIDVIKGDSDKEGRCAAEPGPNAGSDSDRFDAALHVLINAPRLPTRADGKPRKRPIETEIVTHPIDVGSDRLLELLRGGAR